MTDAPGMDQDQEPISFTVLGTPVPQGSKRAFGSVLVDANATKLKPWRQEVAAAALEAAAGRQLQGPVGLSVVFYFTRPRSHFGTGRNAAVLKPGLSRWMSKKPDIDKLERAICDAITTSGAWRDDAQVAFVMKHKLYDEGPARVEVSIYELAP